VGETGAGRGRESKIHRRPPPPLPLPPSPSPTFQRFAVRSNAAAAELAKKSAAKQAELAKSATAFAETFKQEVAKGLEEVSKQAGGKGGGA
jgi:hypothetical protein